MEKHTLKKVLRKRLHDRMFFKVMTITFLFLSACVVKVHAASIQAPKALITINKTNVARLLDKAKVAYELIPYEVDESDLSAVHVAAQLGEDVERVFKTIVLHGDKTGYFVCVVPGEHEIDLKKAARVSGNKKCELLPMKELLPTTGYIRGGCSPIGMKKHFPTYVHETATQYDYVYVSAGQRGLQVKLSPRDLLHEARAEYADLIAL